MTTNNWLLLARWNQFPVSLAVKCKFYHWSIPKAISFWVAPISLTKRDILCQRRILMGYTIFVTISLFPGGILHLA